MPHGRREKRAKLANVDAERDKIVSAYADFWNHLKFRKVCEVLKCEKGWGRTGAGCATVRDVRS